MTVSTPQHHRTPRTSSSVRRLALILGVASVQGYVICVEKSSGVAGAEAIAASVATDTGDAWTAVLGGSASACRDSLKDGTANLVELDAGKSYGVLLDAQQNNWASGQAVPLGKVGDGYLTMAVAKKTKMDSDNVQTICDVLGNKGYRAAHTGYMKTAGWVSPMGAVQECGEAGDSTIKTACSDLTQTGEACHDAVFGDSCVPDITGGTDGDRACKQCPGSSCSSASNDYANYYGAAKCLLDNNCDIAFIKSSTMNCPASGYCLATQAPGVSDSKSVYEKGYVVPADTFVSVPGYGQYMPGHVVVAVGVPSAKLAALTTALESAYSAAGDSLIPAPAQVATTEAITQLLGLPFVETMRNMPYFFEKNSLTRPTAEATATYATVLPSPSSTPTASSAADGMSDGTKTVIGVVSAVAALLLILVFVMISAEKKGEPMFGESVPILPKTVTVPVASNE